jgi:hypothetical protein
MPRNAPVARRGPRVPGGYAEAVSWSGQQEIAAVFAVLAVLAVVFVLVPRPFCWPVLLVVLGLAVIPLIRGEDFPLGAFWLTVAAMVLCAGYIVADLSRAPARARRDAVLALLCLACATWLWVLGGAPARLPTLIGLFLVLCFAGVAWTVSGRRAPRTRPARGDPTTRNVDEELRFLTALHRATSGQVGRRVAVQDLVEFVKLSTTQAVAAAERLLSKNYIEEADGSYALRREGAAVVDKSHGGEAAMPSGDTFNFGPGNPSGIFGSNTKNEENTFISSNVPPEMLGEVLRQAAAVRARVPADQQAELAEAEADVREAGTDQNRQRRGAERLASIARSIGEVGAPLLKAATDLIRVFTG